MNKIEDDIRIIHIDLGNEWRGGQQQVVYLYEGMLKRGFGTILVCQPCSALEKYCIDKQLPYRTIKFAGELDFRAGRLLSKISQQYGADILQLHCGHSVSMGLWAKMFNPKLKLVATRRVDFSIRKNLFSSLKYTNKLLNKIVCISDKIKKVLLNDGISKGKLEIIHSGIDTKRFNYIRRNPNFRKVWDIPVEAVIVGTVAAFVGHKDYPNFIKTAEIVCRQRQDVYFMAVGEGELLKPMQAKVIELGIQNRIVFTGFQNDVGTFLKEFDIFVLASKLEGLGTSILDAMSLGLPVIATKAGGIPEMIDNEVNGILLPIQDANSLADSICRLADDVILRRRLGENALIKVKEFDINKTIEQYLDLYAQLSDEEI